MENKKYFIMILCIIALFSMQFVCASDNTENVTVLASAEDSVLSAPSETKTYTDLNQTISEAADGAEINLEYNYKYGGNDPKTGINITKNLIINGNGAVIDGDSQSSLFNISEGVTVTLKNLTITKAAYKVGHNVADFVAYPAITSKGTLNIEDCTFTEIKPAENYMHNVQNANGSVIYSTADVNIINSTFSNNWVATSSIIYTTGRVSVRGSQFSDNKAYGDDYKGAVIYTEGGIDTIEDSTFSQNGQDKKGSGGVIYIANPDSVTSIKNSTFDFNYAQNGGVIYTNGKIDTIEDSKFWGDMAYVGGVIYAKSVNTIDNSTIDTCGYYSDSSKGAIYLTGSDDLIITNTTFTGGMAGEGSAVYTHGGVSIIGSEITGCVEDSYSVLTKGAICANGDVYIENTTIKDNFAKEGSVVFTNSSVTIINCKNITNNGLHDNNIDYKGGVVYAKGKVTIENSTFGVNAAETGGAIYSESDVDFFNSYANGSGMQRYNRDGSFIYAEGNVNMENSTVDSFIMVSTNAHGVIYTGGNIRVKNSTLTKTDLGLLDSSSVGGAIHAKGNGEVYNSNFTHNNAKQYAALYVGGTLDIYDSLFFNNTHGSAFGEGRTIVNNTNFLNNTGGAHLNGRVIGTNSTLNITNSNVIGTYGKGGVFNGTVFSEDNLFMENCTLNHNHAFEASSTGLIVCTHSNATVKNCEFYENGFSGQDCYGGDIYAGQNAYVENSTFSNSTVYGGQGNTHGLVVYAEQNITFKDSIVDDVYSLNGEHGALTGNYVTVENSNFTNITGFGAFGAAIHANVANVSDSLFYNVDSSDNKDYGGAIYANNTYAYRSNFTHCHAGEGAAIFSENHTEAIENIFVDNMAQYAGQAIFTKTGFIQYNTILNNSHVQWGQSCDVAFSSDKVDSLEYNWWGLNKPFDVYGENRAKTKVSHQGSTAGEDYLPETWVIMDFYITNPDEPFVGQGLNLTTALERYHNKTADENYTLGHEISKRTVYYNSVDAVSGKLMMVNSVIMELHSAV